MESSQGRREKTRFFLIPIGVVRHPSDDKALEALKKAKGLETTLSSWRPSSSLLRRPRGQRGLAKVRDGLRGLTIGHRPSRVSRT